MLELQNFAAWNGGDWATNKNFQEIRQRNPLLTEIVHEFSMRNTPNNLILLGIVNYKPDPASIEFFSKNGRFPLEFLLSLNREWNNPRYFGNLVK